MATYTYDTTAEMDTALAYEADKQGIKPEELFANIVTADMGTLVRNHQEVVKANLYEAYQGAPTEVKASMDAEVAKVEAAKAVPVEEIQPSPMIEVKPE
jgi:hypothetical protein